MKALELLAEDPRARIAIHGEGGSSGLQKWHRVCVDIHHCYDLFKGKVASVPFPEWDGETLSWEQFVRDVTERELGQYTVHVQLIEKYGEETMATIRNFKRAVMDQRHDALAADLLLSTVHAAKGIPLPPPPPSFLHCHHLPCPNP